MRLIDADALIDDFDEQADSMVELYKNSGCDCGPEDIDFNVVDITHTIQDAPTIYSKSTSYHTTTKSDYNIYSRWGIKQGWECPRCGTILAPWMPTCTCRQKSGTWSSETIAINPCHEDTTTSVPKQWTTKATITKE